MRAGGLARGTMVAENDAIKAGSQTKVDRQSRAGQAFAARCLLRAARWATLATMRADALAAPQPFASLVTHAVAPDGAVLMLLSSLAEHVRHLQATPLCAVMAVGLPENVNWQTAPRVTVTGEARVIGDRQARRHWLSRHPYARLYADFTDFSLWRVVPTAAAYVGGFAQAARLTADDMMPRAASVAAVAAAAPALVAHCNEAHTEALNRMAHATGASGAWRLLGVDTDGCELEQDETVLRIAFTAPVDDGDGARAALLALADAAEPATW
jgi:putative heme iron utilization protein